MIEHCTRCTDGSRTSRQAAGWLAGLVLVALMVASRSVAQPQPAVAANGTARMAARLDQINGRQNPMKVQFLSRERAGMMGKELEASPVAREDPVFRAQFGTELLNAGESERAAEQFEIAQARVATVPAADRRVFQSQ